MIVVDKNASRPKVHFTPTYFRKAYDAWKKGDRQKGVELMREAVVDGIVRGCLIGRHAGLMQPFTVQAYDDTEVSVQRRDWLTRVIEQLKPRKLNKALFEGKEFGYVVIDFDWAVAEGLQVPTRFIRYDQHYFRYDGDGPARELRVDWGGRTEPIPEEALVAEADELPEMMYVLPLYILKNFGWETWSGFMETWGEGLLVAKHPLGWGDEEKKSLKDGLRDLGASGRGVVPEGTEIEHFGGATGAAGHQSYKQECDTEISVALLGHGDAVVHARGSTQIGENTTSFQVREEIAQEDLFWLDEIYQGIVRQIWRRNFNDGTEPKVVFNKPKRIDTKEHRESVRMAFDHGLTLHPDEYRKLGLYVYEDQAPVRRDPNLLRFD
jgi:phage gp29-like protein